jgi:type III pantothenate kinase
VILLFDIGNTNTHVGLGNSERVVRSRDFSTANLRQGQGLPELRKWLGRIHLEGACLCSVVPAATGVAQRWVKALLGKPALQLTPESLVGLGINYPRPETIGQDRLANAVAARHHFGAPVIVIDFGTAVTFDVINRRAQYIGGIIAPGLAVMTDYLHEKTALLPRVRIREARGIIGRNTEQAMLIGAVHGYRGLVRALIVDLCRELGVRRLPVVATGGYAPLIARRVPEIQAVRPHLTLEGLRLVWQARWGD